jgi:hypothetical protein
MTENDLHGTCGLKFEVKEEELAQPKCMNNSNTLYSSLEQSGEGSNGHVEGFPRFVKPFLTSVP